MSVLSGGNTIEVFKFKSSGIVALCEEVVSYVNDPKWAHMLRDADLDTGRYRTDESGNHYITFDRI